MKIIFLDADGTLFHHEGYIPESALFACQEAQKNNHKICLCTGRQRVELYGDLMKIQYDGLITGSGAHVEVKGQVLEERTFTKEELDWILSYAQKHQIPIFCESSKGLFATPLGKQKIDLLFQEQCAHLSQDALQNHSLYTVHQLTQVHTDFSQDQINKVSFLESQIPYQEVQAHLQDRFDIVPATFAPFGQESGEISSKAITKATGMDTLIQYFKIPNQDVIAIGDGFNDLCMFEKAHLSIAMGNAHPDVQKKADRITKGLNEDGIYHAFKELDLI